jgi:nuclear protein localization family protein 4
MVLREPGPNEMIPSVVKEGKTVKEFEPDFFIVSLAHGQPKADKDYNILKNYDFPVLNRGR